MPRPADLSNAAAKAKPKVLLVDDHPEVVRSLSRMLSFDFDVVAEATDGQQALEASSRFDPDIVVLDITMPGLNGFQTARELERRGLRARPMFLTMHDAREFVAEGFRSGGWGYVVKTRVHEDLVRAMHCVLDGRLFVPSLDSLATIADDRCRHAVQFYSDDDSLIDGLSGFFDAALKRGDVVSVVARDVIRRGVAEQLQTRGWNLGALGNRYQSTDSGEALTAIMHGDRVDEERVTEIVEGLERSRASLTGEHAPRLTLAGEISVPLFQRGNVEAGLQLERQWDALTHELPFLTLCCYPTACVEAKSADLGPAVCGAHGAIT